MADITPTTADPALHGVMRALAEVLAASAKVQGVCAANIKGATPDEALALEAISTAEGGVVDQVLGLLRTLIEPTYVEIKVHRGTGLHDLNRVVRTADFPRTDTDTDGWSA